MISAPTYFKYAELNPGDVLIEKGTYLETKEGKYGAQHYFEETSNSERKVLNSSGQLNYLVDTYLKEGTVCKIVYKGKVLLSKGAMSGKEAHNFDLYVDDETVEKSVDAASTKAVQDAMPKASNLDDLE